MAYEMPSPWLNINERQIFMQDKLMGYPPIVTIDGKQPHKTI